MQRDLFPVFIVLASAAFLLLAGLHCPVQAEQGFVIGDSIAADLGETIGLRGAAHHSVSLRRTTIADHFARIPKGAVAIMSLGLNDAAIPVKAMLHYIERIIDGAVKTGEKIVWIGPPCVLKSWDNRAKEMDEYLRGRLASTTIQYVSLRDQKICQPELRSGDGEHFTLAGYRYVWGKIQHESSYAALIGSTIRANPNSGEATRVAPPLPRRNPLRTTKSND